MSDVDAALARADEDRHWTTRTSGTASSWAFEDRAVLAAEVKRLRAELDRVAAVFSADNERAHNLYDAAAAEVDRLRELNIALMLNLRECCGEES